MPQFWRVFFVSPMIILPKEKGQVGGISGIMVENTATTSNHLNPQPGAPVGVAEPRSPDLADHFLWCSKLGRYLTVSDGSRFVITDDFRDAPVQPEAAAVASIYSKDLLVAQSALLPLGAPVRFVRVTLDEAAATQAELDRYLQQLDQALQWQGDGMAIASRRRTRTRAAVA